jgi:hypothetical protein
VKIAARAAVVLVAAVAFGTGCSTPPGPDPATSAPALPEDAIAYDDLKFTDRPFPFANSCEQITPDVLVAVGAGDMRDLTSIAGPAGCAVEVRSDALDELWIEQQSPPNPSEPRYFPLLWNAVLNTPNYHRRLLLDGRYYAVENIDFYGGQPGARARATGSTRAARGSGRRRRRGRRRS